MPTKPLAKYNALHRALAAAKHVDEVKDIRDKAEALRTYAKQVKDRTLELGCAEIRLRAERKMGQIFAEQKRTSGLAKGAARKGWKRGSSQDPRSKEITYRDLGIDKHTADRARKLAKLTDAEFEEIIADWRKKTEISGSRDLATVLRAARQAAWEKQETEPSDSRKAFGAYLAVTSGDDSVPPEFESGRQKLEWLLSENFTSANLPPSVNSVAKVVADALWRIIAISQGRDLLDVKRTLYDTVEKLESRLSRLQEELIKERGWAKPETVQPPR